jgi:hypothetical protein
MREWIRWRGKGRWKNDKWEREEGKEAGRGWEEEGRNKQGRWKGKDWKKRGEEGGDGKGKRGGRWKEEGWEKVERRMQGGREREMRVYNIEGRERKRGRNDKMKPELDSDTEYVVGRSVYCVYEQLIPSSVNINIVLNHGGFQYTEYTICMYTICTLYKEDHQ